jgi:hypothetical protein
MQRWGKSPTSNSFQLITEMLSYLKPLYSNRKVVVASDKKKSYPYALEKAWKNEVQYKHLRFDSKVNRNVGLMGRINNEDRYIRQRCATMRRESLDSMKRHTNTNLRHCIYLVKRNFVMPITATRRSETPATRLKLLPKPINWEQVFNRRIIGRAKELSGILRSSYFQQGKTPFYKNNQIFSSQFAA